jgi:hypothetical protein
VALATLAGCATPVVTPEPLFFPTVEPAPPGGVVSTALLDAALLYESGCLWLVSDGVSYLPLWPDGASAEWADEHWIIRYNSTPVAVSGTNVRIAGGEIGIGGVAASRQANDIVGEAIPAHCDNGHFWIAGSLSP